MSETWQSLRGADVDPDIRRFVDTTAAAHAAAAIEGTPTTAQTRAIAEAVRAPWCAGGPVMARTQERQIQTPHGAVRVRIHEPFDGAGRPALIYVHGGGWIMFSVDTHDRLMREYAARAGVVVIGVDYALSPEARFPVALEQVVSVVRWVASAHHGLGIDPDRLAIGGDSAGGNLSFATALTLRDAGEGERLKALVLSYAVFNDDSSPEYHARFGGEGYMLTSAEMEVFWDQHLAGPQDRLNPLAVPLRADVSGLPPMFLTIPECDVLAGQSLDMAKRLEAAGTPVVAKVYAGATHSFLEAVSIAPIADRALQDAADWLAATLKTGMPA